MSKNLANCWLCGAEHEYCPTCGQTHGWKYSACTREHYQILMIKRECEDAKQLLSEIPKDYYGSITHDLSLRYIDNMIK